MNNKFAERLKAERINNKMQRAELAEHVGVSVRTISYWENGERECDFDTLLLLASILGTTTDYLLGAID